jgi:hypothetical protein
MIDNTELTGYAARRSEAPHRLQALMFSGYPLSHSAPIDCAPKITSVLTFRFCKGLTKWL